MLANWDMLRNKIVLGISIFLISLSVWAFLNEEISVFLFVLVTTSLVIISYLNLNHILKRNSKE